MSNKTKRVEYAQLDAWRAAKRSKKTREHALQIFRFVSVYRLPTRGAVVTYAQSFKMGLPSIHVDALLFCGVAFRCEA